MESRLNRRRLFGLIAAAPLAAALPGLAEVAAVAEPEAAADVAIKGLTLAQWDQEFFVSVFERWGPPALPMMDSLNG